MALGDKIIHKHENRDPADLHIQEKVIYESKVFIRRLIRLSPRCEIICDALPEEGIEIQFVRWTVRSTSDPASFTFSGEATGLQSDARMGTILTKGADGTRPALWHPRGFLVSRADPWGRLSVVEGTNVESWWELGRSPTLHLELPAAADATVSWPMVVFHVESPTTVSDIVDLTDIESQRFVKSDWFDTSSVADLWKNLADGAVYDPRDSGQGRFRCQQCAMAWWSYLMALNLETSKAHYRALARWVAWSVCIDLGDDGAWRHGFWGEEPEIHSRMLWDGVRLLLSEHELAPHRDLVSAAQEVTEFAIQNLAEELDGGHLWFLHDSTEGSTPLGVSEPVLGRSENNSLCLNTHIQALCVLSQLDRVTGDGGRVREVYLKGLGALEAALGLACNSGALTCVDRFLPPLLSWKVPHGFGERVLRFIAYRVLLGGYWWARKRAQCLVFPSGYIDRDLGRTILADEYHVVNLKDLCELQRLDPHPWMEEVISIAIQFAASLDFRRALERHPIWAEWVDVLKLTELANEIDFLEAEATVVDVLGGKPLDAMCAESGLWRFRDQV